MASPSTFADAIPYRDIASRKKITSSANDPKIIRELAYKAYIVAGEAKYKNNTNGVIVEAWLPETLATDINANYESPLAQGLNGMLPGLGSIARFAGINLTTQALTAQIWQGGGHIQFSLPLIFQAENSAALEVIEPIKQLFSLTLPKDPAGGGLLQAPGPHLDYKRLYENSKQQGVDLASLAADGVVSAASMAFNTAKEAVAKVLPGKLNSSETEALSKVSDFTPEALTASNKVAQAVSRSIVNSVKNPISLYIGQFLYFPCVVIKDVNPTYDVILSDDKNPMRAVVNINFETFYVPTDRDLEVMFPSSQR